MENIEDEICRITGAATCRMGSVIQELWSGYGVIKKARIDGQPVVIKRIDLSKARKNRRGWQGDFAHRRKIFSYQVEAHFYDSYSFQCDESCRLPKLLGTYAKQDFRELILILEDLDSSGFAVRKTNVDMADLQNCLRWLANFHALFLGAKTDNLWPIGTYWHLETRPDELKAMESGSLKDLAGEIDSRLSSARFKTLVHGDAKIANFCFADDNSVQRVAAVDFQYVGGGVGIKDVAYLFSSCLADEELAEQESRLLDYYFQALFDAFNRLNIDVDLDAVELEWRNLYPYAWADFCRFLLGWSPGHWKLTRYSSRLTDQVIEELTK